MTNRPLPCQGCGLHEPLIGLVVSPAETILLHTPSACGYTKDMPHSISQERHLSGDVSLSPCVLAWALRPRKLQGEMETGSSVGSGLHEPFFNGSWYALWRIPSGPVNLALSYRGRWNHLQLSSSLSALSPLLLMLWSIL